MGNALFIVWRESTEAMLVVGILYAWLKRQPDARTGLRFLWGGVAAGIGLALALAAVMLGLATFLTGDALDYFQVAMMLVAAGLIVQMVLWMRHHGRTMKRRLESEMQSALATANWWGMLVVFMLAVGRESAEAVVFLYGLGMQPESTGRLLVVVALGIALAYATFALLQAGGRFLSWRTFFRFSETLLLLLAGALLVGGVEKLIGLDFLPAGMDPLWNTSALLDDSGTFGGVVASLTGYRAKPALTTVAVLASYWIVVAWLLRRSGDNPTTVAIPARG
jgi:high-affinity iron transporter